MILFVTMIDEMPPEPVQVGERERAVIAAARAFLHEADVCFDLDDPTSPMHHVTVRLEHALQALDRQKTAPPRLPTSGFRP
jgi:hypothetical protein